MHKTIILIPADLTIFDGEGGGAAGATGATAPAAGEQSTGDLSKVVYGVQDSAAEAPQTQDMQSDAGPAQQPSNEDKSKAWQDLIHGDYKDQFDADVQRIVKGRLRDMDNLRQQNAAQQDIIDRLSAKYGVTDLGQIAQAIDNDTSMWESEADKAGMTTEQYMQFQNLQRQNASLIREEQARVEQAQREQKVAAWMQQAEDVRQQYPGFDLMAELQNERFGAMLNSGVPMADAYRVMHFDEIQHATAASAAHQTEAAVTANVRANGTRPVENGVRQQSSFTVKSDVSKLTRADRAEIAKRVQRGEQIRF